MLNEWLTKVKQLQMIFPSVCVIAPECGSYLSDIHDLNGCHLSRLNIATLKERRKGRAQKEKEKWTKKKKKYKYDCQVYKKLLWGPARCYAEI